MCKNDFSISDSQNHSLSGPTEVESSLRTKAAIYVSVYKSKEDFLDPTELSRENAEQEHQLQK
jgi:hypothetical protein